MFKTVKQLTILGACSGIAGVMIYFLIAFISLPAGLTFLLAMLFPLCLLVFFYSLREYICFRADNLFNRLAFLLALLACQTLALMLAIQIGVEAGIETQYNDLKKQPFTGMLRLVDLGMDVAWDVFISLYMIVWGLAVRKIRELKWWGVMNGLLGAGLLTLNLLTFPVPPSEAGLLDLGPIISIYWIGWQFRMLIIGMGIKENQKGLV